MAIGAAIRGMFGPYEHHISEAYRSIYVRIDDFVDHMRQWKPQALHILEVGCGEGAVTERLSAAYPQAKITAIDIMPQVGRLFKGPAQNVRFLETTVQAIAAAEPHQYDFVILADVLHHVPHSLRMELLEAAKKTLAPGGIFVFKDWERSFTPIHWMGYASDRWLTGDRISYMSGPEMRERLASVFGEDAIKAETRIAPWRNNIAFMVCP